MAAVIKEGTCTFREGITLACDKVIPLNEISYEISTGITTALTRWGDVSVGIVFFLCFCGLKGSAGWHQSGRDTDKWREILKEEKDENVKFTERVQNEPKNIFQCALKVNTTLKKY